MCDAKIAHYERVKNFLVPDLQYKYLFSLSTNNNSSINGLNLFYALTDNNNHIESFFNTISQTNHKIQPAVNLIPLSENIEELDQNSSMSDIIHEQLHL